MYHQHRGMLPHNAMQNPRLTELLEQIKTEFESQGQRVAADGHERDTFLNQALEEMSRIQDRSRTIEAQYERSRHEYDARIRQLEHELSTRGGPSQTGHHPHGPHPAPPPPPIGHGPRDLFGQIMSGGQQNVGLGAPPPAPDQPQGLPPHLTQNAAMQNTGPPQPHIGFGGYPQAPGPGPTLNGFPGVGAPQMAASPGPGRGRQMRGPPGTGTPAQSAAPPPYGHPGSPRSHMPTPPPGQRLGPPMGPLSGPQPQMHHAYGPQLPEVGNELWKLHDDQLWPTVPNQLKKEKVAEGDDPGDKWWAVFNPKIRREIDVELVSTLLHTSVVCCVRFSKDGAYIATGCNRSAQIFDASTGRQIVQLEDQDADRDGDLYIRSVCFSPDGHLLATGAEDQMIRVWDINTKTIRTTLRGHTQDIYSLDFSSNGRTIASGSGDKTVRLWDVESGTERFKLEIEDGVTTVALSADGHYVAAGSLDQTVRVWDAETAAPIERLGGDGNNDGHKDSVYSVAFSPHKDELVSGSLDKTIKHWHIRQPPPGSSAALAAAQSNERLGHGVCLRTFSGHADYVLSVGLTHDARYVFSGSKDRGVQFWDPRTGDALLHLCGHRNSVISVAPSPTAGYFATGSGDQKARIWRLVEGYNGGY